MAKHITPKTLKKVRSGMTVYQVVFDGRGEKENGVLTLHLLGRREEGTDLKFGVIWFKNFVVTSSGMFFWRKKDALEALARKEAGICGYPAMRPHIPTFTTVFE